MPGQNVLDKAAGAQEILYLYHGRHYARPWSRPDAAALSAQAVKGYRVGRQMGQVKVVANYGDLCGEGPVWDADSGCLYWTDIDGHRFYRYHQATDTHELLKRGLEIAGYCINQPSGFTIANGDGIWLWDGSNDLRLIADQVAGAKCKMNDAVADPEGRFFAGSNFYDADKEYELGKLIRVDRDGTTEVADEGFHLPNGLAFSPDETIMYFTDSATRQIYAYDYARRTGSLRNRKLLVQVPEEEGLPDGLTVDAEGFLWSAQWYGGCVVRYDPEGKMERRITIAAKQVSSVAFGGKDLTDIFVTSAGKSWPSPLMPRYYDPLDGNFGGQLYWFNLGIQGKPEYKSRIVLSNQNSNRLS
jgi:sugar lactone lactonase YvrE